MLGVAAFWDAITAVCLIVITVVIVATAAVIVFVALKAKSLFAKVTQQVQPIAEKGERVLESVSRTADSAGERLQHIAQEAEETVGFVGERVRSTTAVIADLISHPLISAAAVAAAIRREVEKFGSQSDQTTSQH